MSKIYRKDFKKFDYCSRKVREEGKEFMKIK